MLFRQRRQEVEESWVGVRPLREACVATGMKIGSWTGPWGRVRRNARARVVWRR